MTSNSLSKDEIQLLEIVKALGFGVIQNLNIRQGQPCFLPEPTIVHVIKLNSDPPIQRGSVAGNGELRAEFIRLLDQLGGFEEAVIDLDVRHGIPFLLNVRTGCDGFLQRQRSILRQTDPSNETAIRKKFEPLVSEANCNPDV